MKALLRLSNSSKLRLKVTIFLPRKSYEQYGETNVLLSLLTMPMLLKVPKKRNFN